MTTPAESMSEFLTSKTYRSGTYNTMDGTTDWGSFVYTGVVGYQQRVRPESVSSKPDSSGFRMPTPWSAEYSLIRWPSVTFGYAFYGPYYAMFDGCMGLELSQTALPSFPSNLEDRAITKALLKLKDQKVNFGVMFGERKETASLVRDVLSNLDKQFNRLRTITKMPKRLLLQLTAQSIRRAPQGKYTKDLLNKFLAVQYGVRPLMQDVYGAVAELHRKEADGNSYRVEVKGAAMDRSDETKIYYSQDHNVGYPVSVTTEVGAFVHLTYSLDEPVQHTLSQLGITNPLEIAWELTTLSFVVDWFLPIGNYLGALDAARGYSFIAGTVSKIVRVLGEGGLATPLTPIGLVIGQDGRFSQKSVSMVRQLYDHSPLPTVPRFKNPLSSEHTANAIALAAARLRV